MSLRYGSYTFNRPFEHMNTYVIIDHLHFCWVFLTIESWSLYILACKFWIMYDKYINCQNVGRG